jgi:pimeloyl-ACP methyl ester carboxylesterase
VNVAVLVRFLVLAFLPRLLGCGVAVNATIFCGTLAEHVAPHQAGPWLIETQRLNANAPGPAVIMLHGVGGSPYDFKPLATELARRATRMTIPLLTPMTGGYLSFYLGSWSADGLIESLEATVRAETEATGHKPILVGFSMGGTLASIICAKGLCERLVLIAPFFALGRCCTTFEPFLGMGEWLLPMLPKMRKGHIGDPLGYADYEPGSRFISVASLRKLTLLAQSVRPQVASIDVPTLVFASASDAVADARVTRDALSGLPALTWSWAPDRADHILMYDYGRREMFTQIADFIAPRAEASARH